MALTDSCDSILTSAPSDTESAHQNHPSEVPAHEINTEIALLMQQLEVDEETGEILTSSEDILQQLNALDMERSRILEYLAKVVLDTRAEAAALKAEEERLAKRRRVCEHREERLIEVLDRECNVFVRTDPAGNIKIDKEKSTEKVDGAVALVMGLDRAMKNLNGGDSIYNHRGLIIL